MADSSLHSHKRHIHDAVRHHTHHRADGKGCSVACSQQRVLREMSVALGCFNLGVTEDVLDLVKRSAAIDQETCKAMP